MVGLPVRCSAHSVSPWNFSHRAHWAVLPVGCVTITRGAIISPQRALLFVKVGLLRDPPDLCPDGVCASFPSAEISSRAIATLCRSSVKRTWDRLVQA